MKSRLANIDKNVYCEYVFMPMERCGVFFSLFSEGYGRILCMHVAVLVCGGA